MSVIKNQATLNTIYSFIGVFIGTITAGFIIPNYLSTEQNGLIALLYSWIAIVAQMSGLGFNAAGTKFFDKFRNPARGHNGFLFTGLSFHLIGFSIAVILLLIFKNQIVKSNMGSSELFERYYFLIFPVSLAFMLFFIFDNFAKNLLNTVAGNFYIQVLLRFMALFAILLIAFKWIPFGQGIYVWAVAICIPTVFMIWKSSTLEGFSIKQSNFFCKSDFRNSFMQFSSFSLFTGISTLVITQMDKIMVHRLLDLSSTGIYNTSLLFGSVMGMSYMAINKAASAIIIESLNNNELEKVEIIYKKSSIVLFATGLLLLLVVWGNLDQLFSFIKPEYEIGKYALIIIGIGKLVDLSFGLNALIMTNSRKYRWDALIISSFIIVLYILNMWLIPLFGLNGAAFATVLATIYYNVLRTWVVWKDYKIQPFSVEIIYLITLGLFILLGIYFLPVFAVSTWGKLIEMAFKTGLITLIFYLVVNYIPGFKQSKEIFAQLVGILLRK